MAIRVARPGDIVLIAGKGHETGQEVAGTVHPFDDREVARSLVLCAAWRERPPVGVRNHGDAVVEGRTGGVTSAMRAVLLGGGIALLISLLGTRFAIRQFTRLGYGQPIRDDGPTTHHTKRGTPTMGGGVIILASVVAYFAAKLITWSEPSASALLLIFLFVGLGFVGFLDDYLKVTKQDSRGLPGKAKLVGQGLVALVFGALALAPWLEDDNGRTPASLKVSFLREIEWLALPLVLAILLILLIVLGTSNAVNLADGLDGLATGACVMVFGAYTLVNIWQNNQFCQEDPSPLCYNVRDPLDLAVIAAAITGACFGFLWWNASPGRDLHGRHRVAGPRRGDGRLRHPDPDRAAAPRPGRPVRPHHDVGDRPGRGVQGEPRQRGLPRRVPGPTRPPGLPDRAAAAPLREPRLGAGHRGDPLLDHHRALRRHRPRHLLRRVGRRGCEA